MSKWVSYILMIFGIFFLLRGSLSKNIDVSGVWSIFGLTITKTVNFSTNGIDNRVYVFAGGLLMFVAGTRLNRVRRSKKSNIQAQPELKKEKSDGLPPEVAEVLRTQLKEYEQGSTFEKPHITLESLAAELGSKPRHLSLMLQQEFGKELKTYVYDLKIDRLLTLMEANPKIRRYKLTDIGATVGFRNVKTFKNAFEAKMGIGITEWLDQQPQTAATYVPHPD